MNHQSIEYEDEPNVVMVNNKKVKLSPKKYKKQMRNYVESTGESEWISPSRVRMNTVN